MIDYTPSYELYHHGIKGMKWGVRRYQNKDGSLTSAGKRRDARLAERTKKLAAKSTANSFVATRAASRQDNGSKYYDRSNRYMKRAVKTAGKMSDEGRSVAKTDQYKNMNISNMKAGELYVKRTKSARAKDAVKSAAISTGASFVGMAMGMPIGVLYVSTGPKYELKQSDLGYLEELYHADRKKHKYIAKVKVKKGKYRYFYDKDEYDRYLRGKDFVDKLMGSYKKIEKKVEKSYSKLDDKVDKLLKKNKDKKINGFVLLYTRDQVEDVVKALGKKLDKMVEKKKVKDHKYIEKVKLPNGKYRYFYTQEEYDAYLRRLEYQENEPGFMKKVPNMSDNTVMTQDEDMEEINEDYDPWSTEDSMNCMYCTTAYELRRRGYDVEAADYDSETYGGTFWSLETWYKDATIYHVNSDGSNDDLSKYTNKPIEEGFEPWVRAYSDPINYTGDTIRNGIESNNPPNSRGNLMVYWEGGGGHSMVYETDSRGNVTVRDCQTNQKIDIDRLAKQVIDVNYVRTDNLELQEGVLETIDKN